MKTTPHREHDGGPILNWLSDRAIDLSSILLKLGMKYGKFYVVEFEDEDE